MLPGRQLMRTAAGFRFRRGLQSILALTSPWLRSSWIVPTSAACALPGATERFRLRRVW